MLQQLTIVTAFLGALAAAQDYLNTPNPPREIATCEDLPCDPTGNNICALNGSNDNNNNNNNNDTQPGVGIAPSALRLGSAEISLVLISGNLSAQAASSSESSNDAEGPASAYQHTPHHLFVGIDPSIARADYPSGCLLMLQYQGQTFPSPTDSSARPEGVSGTTSCQGVVGDGCRADVYTAIQSFNRTSSSVQNVTTTATANNETCQALAEHVTTTLARRRLCGDSLIASMMRATGGPLPGTDSAEAEHPRLSGINECRPMLPQPFSMFEVAQTHTWSLRDPEDVAGGGNNNNSTDSMSRLFGGRAGFTPVFSVRFPQAGGAEVQLACMRTYEPSGEALGGQDGQDGQEGAAAGGKERTGVFAVVAGFLAVLFTVIMA